MSHATKGMTQLPRDQVMQEKPMTKALASIVEISVMMFIGL